jgi:hypothetical protein
MVDLTVPYVTRIILTLVELQIINCSLQLTDNINLRGAISTGFRAPSLHQIYFNSTTTQFGGGCTI